MCLFFVVYCFCWLCFILMLRAPWVSLLIFVAHSHTAVWDDVLIIWPRLGSNQIDFTLIWSIRPHYAAAVLLADMGIAMFQVKTYVYFCDTLIQRFVSRWLSNQVHLRHLEGRLRSAPLAQRGLAPLSASGVTSCLDIVQVFESFFFFFPFHLFILFQRS